jgi:hypothetical protein
VGKKKPSYYIWIHINPRAQAVLPVSPGLGGETATSMAASQDVDEYVEVEYRGQKIRGKLIAVLENEKCILIKDESGKLHVIPLEALRKRGGLTVIA